MVWCRRVPTLAEISRPQAGLRGSSSACRHPILCKAGRQYSHRPKLAACDRCLLCMPAKKGNLHQDGDGCRVAVVVATTATMLAPCWHAVTCGVTGVVLL
jgi:hypothetical protein